MRRWKEALASAHLLPHVHTPLVLYILSIHMMLLPATGPLHVPFLLPETTCPSSSPSPSLSPLAGYSYPFFRSWHKHPCQVSLCVLLTNCTFTCVIISTALVYFWSYPVYLSMCQLFVSSQMHQGPWMSHPQISPNAPHNSVRPRESPHSIGWMNKWLSDIIILIYLVDFIQSAQSPGFFFFLSSYFIIIYREMDIC